MSSAYRIWASVVALAVIVQVGLAGYGAFHAVDEADDKGTIAKKTVENGFDAHAGLGYLILIGSLVLLVLAYLSRRERPDDRRVVLTAVLLGLLVLQVLLAWLGDAVAGLGSLHPINALAIAALSGALAGRAWGRRAHPAARLP